jgi:hypothetical protein
MKNLRWLTRFFGGIGEELPGPRPAGPPKRGARQRRYTGLVEPHPRRRARRSARWAALIVLVLLGGGPSLGRAEMDATAPGPLAAARLAGSHYVN